MVRCRGDGADRGAECGSHPASLLGKSVGAQTLSARPLQRRSAVRSPLRAFFLPVFFAPGFPGWMGGVRLLDPADLLVPVSNRRQAVRAAEKENDLELNDSRR